MPIYEYRCESCGATFEHLHRTLTEPVPNCPECGAAKPRKLVSNFAAVAAGDSAKSACEGGTCSMPSSSCPTGTCPFG